AEDTHRGRPPRRTGEVAHLTRQPADVACDGQSPLAVALRGGARHHTERLLQDGLAAFTPRTAPLPRRRASRNLLAEEPPPHHPPERDLQASDESGGRRAKGGRGEQAPVAAESLAARRRRGARRNPRRECPPRPQDGRAVRPA